MRAQEWSVLSMWSVQMTWSIRSMSVTRKRLGSVNAGLTVPKVTMLPRVQR